MNESSSLLGGSPRRQCGRKGSPYHTGQLHPAVRVADLLQHINQMKTAEGYGFKQEYEVGFLFYFILSCETNHFILVLQNSEYFTKNYSLFCKIKIFVILLFYFLADM